MHRTKTEKAVGAMLRGAPLILLGWVAASGVAAQTQPAPLISPQTSAVPQDPEIAQLEAYLAQDPEHVDALYTYARTLIKAQRMAEARKAYLEILRLRPGHLATTMELAMLDQQMQQLDSARAGYEQLLRSDALTPEVRAEVGQRLAQLNQALKPHQIYGSVTLGLTAQHNANSGPAGQRASGGGCEYFGQHLPFVGQCQATL